MANELVIQYDNLPQLINGGDHILVAPEGEQLIIKLYELKALVEKAEEAIKEKLRAGMEAIDPDLSSINSDLVKILYRVYGAKYTIDENTIEFIDPKFYTEKKSYSPNTVEIDKFISETGTIPSGISINPRSKSLSIKVKDNE